MAQKMRNNAIALVGLPVMANRVLAAAEFYNATYCEAGAVRESCLQEYDKVSAEDVTWKE